MITLLVALISLYVGYQFPIWKSAFLYFLEKRKMSKFAPSKVDQNKMCKAPHTWIDMPAISDKGNITIKVCRLCGFVSGSDQMLPPDTLDQIEEDNKIRAIEARLDKEFIDKEEADVRKLLETELQNGLNYEKIVTIHAAGQTFNQRCAMYKASKSEEISKELMKVNA